MTAMLEYKSKRFSFFFFTTRRSDTFFTNFRVKWFFRSEGGLKQIFIVGFLNSCILQTTPPRPPPPPPPPPKKKKKNQKKKPKNLQLE